MTKVKRFTQTLTMRPPGLIERLWFRRLRLQPPRMVSVGSRSEKWARLVPMGLTWFHRRYATAHGPLRRPSARRWCAGPDHAATGTRRALVLHGHLPTVHARRTRSRSLMATPPLRIMSLDLSLNATGVCLPDGRVMTIKCKAAWGDTRLCVIRDTIRRFLPKTDLVVIEDKVHASYSASVLGMVQGAVRTELMDQGVPYALVPAKTIKKYATGNGNADKAEMMAAAKRRAGLIFKDDNQCDAWWVRQCALDHYDLGVEYRDPDPALSARLDVVDWPDMSPVRVG